MIHRIRRAAFQLHFGTVSIQPSGSDDWGRAYPNLPVGPGDRIYTDQDGQVEVQVGQTYIRIGPNSDVTLVNDDQNAIAWGVAQGSVHVQSFGLWQGQSLDLSTANSDARIGNAGEFRVDVVPDQGATIFTSLGNGLVVTGAGGFWQQMGNWQSLEVAGTNPVDAQWLQPAGADELDQWSQQRDRQIQNAASYQYVNPEMPGAADLDANGDWTPDSDYGPVWFPRNVSADWEPYHNGHWVNRDPWGWVWVEDEPWGYAPFHYGRWVSYRGAGDGSLGRAKIIPFGPRRWSCLPVAFRWAASASRRGFRWGPASRIGRGIRAARATSIA